MADSPELPSFECFEGQLGSTFKILSGESEVTLTLKEAVEHGDLMATDPEGSPLTARKPFSITLEGPKDPQLPAAIHLLSHELLGGHHLYMKPYLETGEAIHYEIVFN